MTVPQYLHLKKFDMKTHFFQDYIEGGLVWSMYREFKNGTHRETVATNRLVKL